MVRLIVLFVTALGGVLLAPEFVTVVFCISVLSIVSLVVIDLKFTDSQKLARWIMRTVAVINFLPAVYVISGLQAWSREKDRQQEAVEVAMKNFRRPINSYYKLLKELKGTERYETYAGPEGFSRFVDELADVNSMQRPAVVTFMTTEANLLIDYGRFGGKKVWQQMFADSLYPAATYTLINRHKELLPYMEVLSSKEGFEIFLAMHPVKRIREYASNELNEAYRNGGYTHSVSCIECNRNYKVEPRYY